MTSKSNQPHDGHYPEHYQDNCSRQLGNPVGKITVGSDSRLKLISIKLCGVELRLHQSCVVQFRS